MLKRKGPLLVVGLLALVGAVGTMSVAYALWSKTLNIEGTVDTGRVHARWSQAVSTDPPGALDLKDEMGNRYEKDVGMLECAINPDDPEVLDITIHNGYPSYMGGCEAEYTVLGSVPVVVESISFAPGQGLTNCSVDQSQNTGTLTVLCDQLTVKWTDGLCVQLHPGDEHAGSLKVHVEQEAEMSSEYTFDLGVLLVQFNESNCP